MLAFEYLKIAKFMPLAFEDKVPTQSMVQNAKILFAVLLILNIIVPLLECGLALVYNYILFRTKE